MRTVRTRLLTIGICAAALAATACGSSPQTSSHGGSGGTAGGGAGAAGYAGGATGGSGAGGTSGSGGSGVGGTSSGGSGVGGTSGSGGTSGTGGGGTGGTGGGTGGTGGTGGGTGGTGGGTGGTSGSGGSGVGGTSGSGGSGVGGTSGSGGSGTGGTSGSGGTTDAGAGAGGTATGGTGGTATGGTVGTDAGSDAMADADAGPQCQTNADCADGSYCDGVEKCVAGVCQPGIPIVCTDDGFSCTKEFCDESTKSCQRVPQDSVCQDNKFCDGTEKCDPSAAGADPVTGCVAGTPVDCNDNISCTIDTCSNTLQKCVHTPDDTKCPTDGFCEGGQETCDPTNGDPTTGCLAGTPPDCNDHVACTNDSCSDTLGKCVNTPDNTKCDDGLYCDGVETCNATAGCQPGTPVSCPNTDGIACTVESCDETNHCHSTPDSSLCPSGETCVAGVGCETGSPCTSSTQCDDGNACNGKEYCDIPQGQTQGVCKPGTPVNCNDNIGCTYDQCDPATGTCSHTPYDVYCDDGNACDGKETCDPNTGCVAGTPLDCNDNVPCTIDGCDPSSGCTHIPDNSVCSDNKVCDGVEQCDPSAAGADANGCIPGTPPNCPSDGIPCTKDICVESAGGCTHVPDDSQCSCGQTCDPTQGCGNWCNVSTCQGKVYQCGDCVDNDGDCKIDSHDPDCIGVCDNNESGFYGNIPGQNNAPCKEDCYFDQDTGSGNDQCYWSHSCDPLEVSPNYDPYGKKCEYNPNTNVSGTKETCAELQTGYQLPQCLSYCGPLTPNGCDCFGCCAIPGAATTVFLGSLDSSGNGSCTLADVSDPTKCRPCTQVTTCLNTCDHCELCIGKTTLPSDCTQQTCPSGVQLCGQPGDAPCPVNYYCVTGCCQAVPN